MPVLDLSATSASAPRPTTHGTVPGRLTHGTGTLDLHWAHGSGAPGPPVHRPTDQREAVSMLCHCGREGVPGARRGRRPGPGRRQPAGPAGPNERDLRTRGGSPRAGLDLVA